MASSSLAAIYALPLAAVWIYFGWRSKARSSKAQAVLEENAEAGLLEPSSLHPVIDLNKCLGCGTCVRACPEKSVIDIIDGRAALVEPTMCVGHGACAAACPLDAISLVFGTETRGVEIPLLTPEFETSVPGIYIAGELGGMGLVKNAVEQGRQAMQAIAKALRKLPRNGVLLDVVIVGCGPAGISASLGAIEAGLDFITIDQSSLGGTVAHFPRGKMVMTAPAYLPIIGQMKFSEVGKEELIAFWEDVIERTGLTPQFGEQVTGITGEAGHFRIETSEGEYHARTVLLAIGRRGTPRPLGVPGEELDKVTYRLIDPEQYRGARVLVVGGGDSALEAAIAIAEQRGTNVTLSYRSKAYSRAKRKNRVRLAELVAEGRIDERLESTVASIDVGSVTLSDARGSTLIDNDAVIICAGGILPNNFLKSVGVAVETKFGTL